jgi:hypothetical protein
MGTTLIPMPEGRGMRVVNFADETESHSDILVKERGLNGKWK